MGKIDPHQLLSLFRADLTAEGGIRNEQEILHKLSGLIPNYSKKLVTRCVYLNVLKETEEQALDQYLENKGWETLNTWLKTAKEDDNQPFLTDMLDLLLRCPVTVDRLKKTDTAKLVKGLRKEGNSETVVSRANRLFDKWLAVIGAAPPLPAAADAGTAVPGSENGAAAGKAKKTKTRKGSVDGNDSSSSSNSSDAAAVQNGVAAVTAKSVVTGQGLAVASQNNKLKSGKSEVVNGSTATTITNPNTTAAAPILTPSDLFMNAVTAAVLTETPKRKKKIPSSDLNSDPSVHKKTKISSESLAADPIDDTLSRIIEQDMSNKNILSPEFNRSISDMPVTPITTPTTAPTAITPLAMKPAATATPNTGTLAIATADMTPGPDKSFPRGCLLYGSSSSKKKVRWLPDESMTRVKYFDAGKDERVNVWRQQMQEQNESKLAEGQAFKDRSMNDSSSSSPDQPGGRVWSPLLTIDVPDGASSFRGRDSQEKISEAQRQSVTLADLFVSRELCPESPAEPDAASLQSMPIGQQMVVIPLDDGQQVSDFSLKPLPPPRNNPLFGETFLRPHQMELDHHVMSGIPAASAPGPGFMFASSYGDRTFPVPGKSNASPNRGPGNFNNNNNSGGSVNPRNLNMRDLRNAKGQQVCSYFFRHGNCHRDPCRFIHTRDVVEWNANGPIAGPPFRPPGNRRNGRPPHASPPNETPQSSFASDWNSTVSASITS